jgi:predicted ribosome quality control (RQC) complex YloA/Tae2 family protein
MNKKNLSSLEIAALVQELQFLIHGKISQIYHQDPELVLQLHAVGQGKQLLKIIPGKVICLTKDKNAPDKPTGFCLQLRKYLDGAIINSLHQKETERIVVFDLECHKEKYHLILELFSKGNIILTDKDQVVIAALESQVWKDRTVKPREKYTFPVSEINYKNLTKDKLKEILHKSEKKNLATSLATEIGLGGAYAEEVCTLSKAEKSILPKEVEEKEIALIYKAIKELLERIKESKGYIYSEEITPFPLTNQNPVKTTPTYNEAIDTLNPFQKASPYEKKIESIRKILEAQLESIKNMEENIELNKRKGELIYENYAPLQKLLETVKEMRKSKEWKEIEEELKKVKKISKIDLKNKKIVIDL